VSISCRQIIGRTTRRFGLRISMGMTQADIPHSP
jgi:hypothetical protein